MPARAACGLLCALLAGAAAALPPASVQPSGDEVPANLLRISVVFEAPVHEPVLPRLRLRRDDGRLVERPFLEQELWSPSGRILTVLLHPGRVKSGLAAHDAAGPVLEPGERVGIELDGRVLRRWTVGADDRDGPAPADWRLRAPPAGTRAALVVELDAPIDGRDADYLAVADAAGRRVAGASVLSCGERRWSFVPGAPWPAGAYRLAVFAHLEDPSGNRLGGRFEREPGAPPPEDRDAALPFVVAPGAGADVPACP